MGAGCAVPSTKPPVMDDPTPLARCAVQAHAASPLVVVLTKVRHQADPFQTCTVRQPSGPDD